MAQWPLPLDEMVVDLPSIHGSLAALAQPSTHARAISAAMIECKHLLPSSQCSWCAGSAHLEVEDPQWEKKDYAQRELVEGFVRDVEDELQAPNGEIVFDPREVYGVQRALRIKQALRERSVS